MFRRFFTHAPKPIPAVRPVPILRPFTVVRDWDNEVFEQGPEVDEEPQIFHVWAKSGSDAYDESERLAVEKWGEGGAYWLRAVAVLQGHAYFAQD
ncbi:hypothetical protein [Streptomyces californicus]|uniref:hypothetical protein n=1 Tax=Streptomyces californicus TaxID=67351 RepID=UPI0036B1C2E9